MSRVDEYNALFKELAKKKLRVGWFPSSQYKDGTYAAQVALCNEFGTKSIPPRPFIRPTIANEKSTWAKYATKLVKRKGITADDVLSDIGNLMKADVQKIISLVTAPPLSELTMLIRQHKKNSDVPVGGALIGKLAKKLGTGVSFSGVSSKPLEDTGYMRDSINYDIVKR